MSGRVRAASAAVSRRAARVARAQLLVALVSIQWLLTIVTGIALGRRGSIWMLLAEVCVLLPATLVLVHATALRLGGRLFAAWTAAVWVALPYVGLAYANHSFRHDYAQGFLRRALGLGGDARTVAMACCAAAVLFTLRAIEHGGRADIAVAVAAAAAGAALAPRAALIGIVPLVGLLFGRRARDAVRVAPAVAILLGAVGAAVAAGLLDAPFAHVGLQDSGNTLASLSENLWSGRVLEWLAIAGVAGALRGNRAAGAMIGVVAAAAFFSVPSEALPAARNLALLHALLPAWPAVALTVASVPLLWPRRRTAPHPTAPALAGSQGDG